MLDVSTRLDAAGYDSLVLVRIQMWIECLIVCTVRTTHEAYKAIGCVRCTDYHTW